MMEFLLVMTGMICSGAVGYWMGWYPRRRRSDLRK